MREVVNLTDMDQRATGLKETVSLLHLNRTHGEGLDLNKVREVYDEAGKIRELCIELLVGEGYFTGREPPL